MFKVTFSWGFNMVNMDQFWYVATSIICSLLNIRHMRLLRLGKQLLPRPEIYPDVQELFFTVHLVHYSSKSTYTLQISISYLFLIISFLCDVCISFFPLTALISYPLPRHIKFFLIFYHYSQSHIYSFPKNSFQWKQYNADLSSHCLSETHLFPFCSNDVFSINWFYIDLQGKSTLARKTVISLNSQIIEII